jgi:hypothetical protein
VIERWAAVSWRDRLCRLKARPVQSAGGLFVIWTAWRRRGRCRSGRQPPPWTRFLAATQVATPAALIRRFAVTRGRAREPSSIVRRRAASTRIVARR